MKEWKLKALTHIWTGDADGKSGCLIPTGIMGSLRWWFEVLVRGLGGKACDPTVDGVRCPDKEVKNPHDPGHHCVVCELFGCTGWARKFRLMVVGENHQVIQGQITAGRTFTLRFIPLRPIAPEEWCLLDATLRLIADYGAIGGKTVFKPSDEPNRQNRLHHQDFGLIAVEERPDGWQCNKTLEDIRAYVRSSHWREVPHSYQDNQGRTHDFSWASLQNFWCVKGRYLARQNSNQSSFNRVIGRQENKSQAQQLFQNTDANRWLAGRQQESKKVFSFKHPEEGGRTFGFVKPGLVDFEEMKRRLSDVWEDSFEFQEGEQILVQLFQQEGRQ
jgi:CRISPR-associated protein Cmr1